MTVSRGPSKGPRPRPSGDLGARSGRPPSLALRKPRRPRRAVLHGAALEQLPSTGPPFCFVAPPPPPPGTGRGHGRPSARPEAGRVVRPARAPPGRPLHPGSVRTEEGIPTIPPEGLAVPRFQRPFFLPSTACPTVVRPWAKSGQPIARSHAHQSIFLPSKRRRRIAASGADARAESHRHAASTRP